MNENTTPGSLIPDDLPEWQGRKGNKAKRFNIAFNADNSAFLDIVSKDYHVNVTSLVNHILDRYRTEHPEVMEIALNRQKIMQSDLLPTKKETDTGKPGRPSSI